jgi:NitT/TauT family transport system permease protein
VLVGVPLGILLARSRTAERASSVTFQFLRMISPLTWTPVAIITLGIGDRPVVFLIAAAAVWPVLLSTSHGVAGVDQRWIAVAGTLGARGRELVRRVLIPAALPDVLNGLRLALGVAWIVLVPAEMLGVRSGVGYFILDTRDRFAYDELGALVLVIGALGYALDAGMRLVRDRLAWDRT